MVRNILLNSCITIIVFNDEKAIKPNFHRAKSSRAFQCPEFPNLTFKAFLGEVGLRSQKGNNNIHMAPVARLVHPFVWAGDKEDAQWQPGSNGSNITM